MAESEHILGGEGGVSEHKINILLVLATLIASVTFQAGVNPPGGVWQEYPPVPDLAAAPPPLGAAADYDLDAMKKHRPGKAILANSGSYIVYIICNTAAFSASSCMIGYLVEASGKFKVLVRLSLFFMSATYTASVIALRPERGAIGPEAFFCAFFLALLVPFIVLFARNFWKQIKGTWDQRWR